jgi:anion transporter
MRDKVKKHMTGTAKNVIPFLILVLFSIVIMLIRPCSGLSVAGHLTMGFTIMMIGGWLFRPWRIPNSVSGLFFLGTMLIIGVPADTVFSGFSQSALWTLIPALFFGFALQKTGLGRRIATALLRTFPSRWSTVALAWVVIGVVLSLVTPSMTVRAAIMIPIAVECCELYGLRKGSNESSFFVITALMMAIVPGNGWITGGLNGPIIQGIFESTSGLAGVVTFESWMGAALVPVLITTAMTVLLGFAVLRPKERLSKEVFLTNSKKGCKKISPDEIKAATILAASCVLFFTSNLHGIPTAAVCLLAVVLLFSTGVIAAAEFTTGINWDLIFFVGTGLCMSQIFTFSGLSEWLSATLSPAIGKLAETPILMIFILLVVLFIWRFVDITTLVPTIVILAPIISTVSKDYGIDPMVWTVIFTLAISSIFLSYTNMWASMGKKLAGGYAWEETALFKYGVAYFAASCIGIACTIPLWQLNGLL